VNNALRLIIPIGNAAYLLQPDRAGGVIQSVTNPVAVFTHPLTSYTHFSGSSRI